MRAFWIRCTWRDSFLVEVEDDVDLSRVSTLSDMPGDVFDQLDPNLAELVDWKVTGEFVMSKKGGGR
jgi:hypothetical protein